MSPADDLAHRPYQTVIALRVSDNPIFTRSYIASLQRQVRDQLASYFGPLAEVKVISNSEQYEALPAPGETETARAAEIYRQQKIADKLFLVALEHREGLYDILSQAWDGDTLQLTAPRMRSTPDRQWVGRAICLAVADDFAPVARVTPSAQGGTAELEFRGGAWAKELAALLPLPAILQPVRLEKTRDGGVQCTPLNNTVLRLEHATGIRQAVVESNLSDPWKKTSRVESFLALKLPVSTGRIRLRVVDLRSGVPVQGCTLYATSRGYSKLSNEDLLPPADVDGYVLPSRQFSLLAYVRILHGDADYKIPLPITGPWTEMVCRIPLDRSAADKSDLQRRLAYFVEDVHALQVTLDSHVRELNTLNEKKRYEEALSRVQSVLAMLKSQRFAAEADAVAIERRAGEIGGQLGGLFASAQGELKGLAARQKELESLSDNLDSTVKQVNAANRAKVAFDLGRQAEEIGEIDEALKKYRAALEDFPEYPQLAERVDRLDEIWRIKSPAHQAARDFITGKWAATEVTSIGSQLAEAERSLAALQALGDYLTARKLLNVNSDRLDDLSRLLEALSGQTSDADRQELDKYTALVEKLADFQKRVAGFIEQAEAVAEQAQPAPAPAPAAPANKRAPSSADNEEEPLAK